MRIKRHTNPNYANMRVVNWCMLHGPEFFIIHQPFGTGEKSGRKSGFLNKNKQTKQKRGAT